jgi:hypothetical protein
MIIFLVVRFLVVRPWPQRIEALRRAAERLLALQPTCTPEAGAFFHNALEKERGQLLNS